MLQFVPFWKLTYFGWSPLYNKVRFDTKSLWSEFFFRSFDEYHNSTTCLIVPFIGSFTIVRGSNYATEHVYGTQGDEVLGYVQVLGYVDPDCDFCTEITTELSDCDTEEVEGVEPEEE